MLHRILKLAGLAHGEWPRLAPMAVLYFLMMMGLAIGRSANDSFFLLEEGASSIPIIFLFNSVMMVVVSYIYSAVEQRFARFRLFVFLIIAFALALAGLRLLIPLGYRFTPFALFCYYELFILIMQMHYWTYANDLFDPREGRRIFPIIGGAGLIGIIAGGLLTGPLVGLFGTVNLFYLWIGIMLAMIGPVLWSERNAETAHIDPHTGDTDDVDIGLLSSFGALRDSQLVRALAYVTIPLWIVVHTVDYLFYVSVEDIFQDQDELTAFLGTLNGLVSLVGLLIQLFLTARIIRKLGVAVTFSIYAITMTAGAIALAARALIPAVGATAQIFHPRNLLVAAARFCDESILYSFHDSATQLLYNALPSEWRGQARAFVNGVIEPATTAFAGGVLFLLEINDVSPARIGFGVAVVGVLWLYLALRVRRKYTQALVENLSSRDIDQRNVAMERLSGTDDQETIDLLFETIRGKRAEPALLAIEYLKPSATAATKERLMDAIPEALPEAARHIILFMGESNYSGAANRLLKIVKDDSKPELRSAAVRALSLLGEERKLPRGLLKDPGPDVRREAIVANLSSKKRIVANNPARKALTTLTRSRSTAHRLEGVRAIAELGRTEFVAELERLSKSKSEEIRMEVVRALGFIPDPRSVRLLIRQMEDPFMTQRALSSLIAIGRETLPSLHHELLHGNWSDEVRVSLTEAIGEIGEPESIEVLGKLLVMEYIEVEDAAVDALAAIRAKMTEGAAISTEDYLGRLHGSEAQPGDSFESYMTQDLRDRLMRAYSAIIRKISKDGAYLQALRSISNPTATQLLVDAVERKSLHRELVALKFLELLDNQKRVRAAAASLRNRDRRSTAEAIELIERCGKEGSAFAWILELKYNEESPLDLQLPLEDLLMELLVQKDTPWFSASVLDCIARLEVSELEPTVREYCKDKNPIVRGNAARALRAMKAKLPRGVRVKEAEQMALDMERILFLRSVPIFRDVDGNDLRWINEIAREKRMRQGHTVFHENDVGDALYIIMEGKVRIYRGEDITLQIMERRDCFGEMAILDQEPRSASAEIMKKSRLLAIKRDDFQRLLLARPQISFAMFRTISRRLREATARLGSIDRPA